ncbi:MAG: uracil-DNA glycosylase [Burkholderiaceae bacterium]
MIAAPAARPVAEPAMSAPAPAPAPAPRSIASLLPAALRPAQAPSARRAGEEGEGADAARRQAIAAMGWDELAASVAGCRACQLCESRRNTVFGVGNARAQWMIVGEAPGENEDLQGEPFVGPAGQLLDNMLRALDLTRADGDGEGGPERQVYIANTLKCRPPRNRNPEPEELARCEPYLDRQIALVQPRIILALGRFAVQSLLRSSEPIGRLRGRVHEYQGVPLIVSYHPAYLLRNPADKARAWEDLCLARDVWRQRSP